KKHAERRFVSHKQKTDAKKSPDRRGPAADAENSAAPIKNEWDGKCGKHVADYLIKVQGIDSKVMPQKGHKHLITGCQMNRRKCCGVHIDARMTHAYG